jgi:hypothetical protein
MKRGGICTGRVVPFSDCLIFVIFSELKVLSFPPQSQVLKPQMVMSIDNSLFDLRRPFESPVPTDPKANICGKSEIEKVKIKIILFPL